MQEHTASGQEKRVITLIIVSLFAHLALLAESGLEAVLGAQVPRAHIAVLATAHQHIAALHKRLHIAAMPYSHKCQSMLACHVSFRAPLHRAQLKESSTHGQQRLTNMERSTCVALLDTRSLSKNLKTAARFR